MRMNITKYASIVDSFVNNKAVPAVKTAHVYGMVKTAGALQKLSDKLAAGSKTVMTVAINSAAHDDSDILGIR